LIPHISFQQISDDNLLTLVQNKPSSTSGILGILSCGMARERNTSGDYVTTGGSGFGIMDIIVAIERGFISEPTG